MSSTEDFTNRRQFIRNLTLAGAVLGFSGMLSGIAGEVAGSRASAPDNHENKGKNMAYTLPPLAYAYNAVEPYIDAQTMEIHHSKHHNAYVTNLNAALAKEPTVKTPECVCELISDLSKVPESIRVAVRNNGGGHFNHSFFWKLIAPGQAHEPVGALAGAVQKTFGGLDGLKEKFNAAATSRFGSGWAWLIVKPDGTLAVTSTPNQDSPVMAGVAEVAGKPVLGLDVWEHAYYLKYQNRRPDYVASFWNALNWARAEENYQKALK